MKISCPIIILLSFILISCQESKQIKPSLTQFSGRVMTIDYRISVGGPLSGQDLQRIEEIIASTFETVNSVFNNWNPDSEISKLNLLAANTPLLLSEELYEFLILTSRVVELTQGRFDPTVQPLHALWKKNLMQGKRPSQAEINEISSAVGWHHIHLEQGWFYKDDARTAIDLGGIAKGHAVDLLALALEKNGYHNVLVDWGGEIRALGNHPSGRHWTIFISNLGSVDPENALAKLDMDDLAIATSGDYLQNWTLEDPQGKLITYTHIIHPQSKTPLIASGNSIASASVAASSCMLADALATALMLFASPEEAESWINQIQTAEMPLRCWLATRTK